MAAERRRRESERKKMRQLLPYFPLSPNVIWLEYNFNAAFYHRHTHTYVYVYTFAKLVCLLWYFSDGRMVCVKRQSPRHLELNLSNSLKMSTFIFCCFPPSLLLLLLRQLLFIPSRFSVIVVANQLMRKCILFLLHFFVLGLGLVLFTLLLYRSFSFPRTSCEVYSFALIYWTKQLIDIAKVGIMWIGGWHFNKHHSQLRIRTQFKWKCFSFWFIFFSLSSIRFLLQLCSNIHLLASTIWIILRSIFKKYLTSAISAVARDKMWDIRWSSAGYSIMESHFSNRIFFMVTSKYTWRPSAVTLATASMHENDKFERGTPWHRHTECSADPSLALFLSCFFFFLIMKWKKLITTLWFTHITY